MPGPLVLVSPLQSVECVYYNASMTESTSPDSHTQLLSEERSVEFFVRDATGQVRVLPGDAHWFVEPALNERTSLMGEEPAAIVRARLDGAHHGRPGGGHRRASS